MLLVVGILEEGRGIGELLLLLLKKEALVPSWKRSMTTLCFFS
jgi:hypothetical protein